MPAEDHLQKPNISILELAQRYAEAGLSVIPIRADGSKAPDATNLPRDEEDKPTWVPYQREIAGPDELRQMFSNGCGIAIVCGRVSGNLEVIDFDDNIFYEKFAHAVTEAGRRDLLERLPAVRTPRGLHLLSRCDSATGGNQKLAQTIDGEHRIKTVIETRREGGYVLTVGSPANCHPSGGTYQLERGDLLNIPKISAGERDFLLSTARALNGYHKQESKPANEAAGEAEGGRPGDDFNKRATWKEILQPHGWKPISAKGDKEEWKRPGKDGKGISATTNYKESGLLYVFSTSTEFETERGYSKFSVYAILNHAADFKAAARDLAAKGYGQERKQAAAPTHQNIPGRVREYIDSIEGTFSTFQIYSDLGITDPKDKGYVRVILNRIKGTVIEPHGNQAGYWRKVEATLQAMDLLSAEGEDLDLWLPLDLHNCATIMPGNEIIVTGDPDAGKTAFLLQTIYRNLGKWDCHYFNSEMGAYELRKRLQLFRDFPITHLHFHAYERSDCFADVVKPGKYVLNVIDYLEITEEFYRISKRLADIYKALHGAVAIIAIQKKNRTSDLPLGAQRALEKPRLAIALSAGNRTTLNKATILKCKNRKTEHSLIGRSRPFKLIAGCEFKAESPLWE